MQTEELIELVTRNHNEVKSRHDAAQKKLDENKTELNGVKSQLTEIEQKMARKSGAGFVGGVEEQKSVGQMIVDSDELKAFRSGGARGQMRLETKTVVVGTSVVGGMIAPTILTDPVILPRRRPTVRSLLAPGQTDSNSVWFSRMTSRTVGAATVLEGGQKQKSDMQFAQIQTPVSTIAHLMQISRQALDDASALRSTIDAEMSWGLTFAEENQLLFGDGTGANLLGLVPQATAYSGAFAVTGETAIDRIALAVLQSELALLPASGIILNPADWMKLRMLKDSMGKYLIGNPTENIPPSLWGLRVVPTISMSAGNFLCGAFDTAAQIFDRLSTEILISNENLNNFEINQLTVRAEERLALAVKMPAALIYGTLP